MVITYSGICMWGAAGVAPFFTAGWKDALHTVR